MSAFAEWENGLEGMRLDRAIAERLDLSRSRARALLDSGVVEVDGRKAGDKGLRLELGQRVRVLRDPSRLDDLVPCDRPLTVLAEGEGWIAVDKPAGLPVHPLAAGEEDSVLQRLATLHPEIADVGEGGLRSGVVHRLDVDTSGVQLFALDERRFTRLRDAFRRHRIDKVYRALVAGGPDSAGAIELDLEITRHRPALVRARRAGKGSPKSRSCPLRWVVRERFDGAALVEVRPRTGFLHQIRVTFAWLGHPLLGDAVYGDGEGAPRQMLHASRVVFADVVAQAADPADFVEVLQALRDGVRWRGREG